MKEKIKWYWCAYHQEILLKLTDKEYRNRLRRIEETKPDNEKPIRFNNFQQVKGQLPIEVQDTGIAYAKAGDAYDRAAKTSDEAVSPYDQAAAQDVLEEARVVYYRMRDVHDKAVRDNLSAIRVLYEKEITKEYQVWNWNKMKLDFGK